MTSFTEPIFIKTKGEHYFFDVENNQIHGPKKYTRTYWHEVSHFKDHQKGWYKHLNLLVQWMNQTFALTVCLMGVYGIFNHSFAWMTFLNGVGILFIPYCIFSFQEELRAEIYSFFKYQRCKRLGICKEE